MKYLYGPQFHHRICNWKHTGNMDQPDWSSNFLSGACEKRSRDDWRQILVEASCERSVGESVQQVSSCNDCLNILFAQLKCWSRHIYMLYIYIYLHVIYIYIYLLYMLYPDFMLYIHTACMHIYIYTHIICTYTGWCDSQCRQEGVPINLELGGGWLGVPHHPKNGNVGGEDDDEFLILSYPILFGTPKWDVEYWKFSKISLLA